MLKKKLALLLIMLAILFLQSCRTRSSPKGRVADKQKNHSTDQIGDKIEIRSLGKVNPKSLVMSAKGGRIAWVEKTTEGARVVVDGRKGSEFDGIAEKMPVFSPDGKRMAYGAKRGDKLLVVVDDHEGPEFTSILKGSRAFENAGTFRYFAGRTQSKNKLKNKSDDKAENKPDDKTEKNKPDDKSENKLDDKSENKLDDKVEYFLVRHRP